MFITSALPRRISLNILIYAILSNAGCATPGIIKTQSLEEPFPGENRITGAHGFDATLVHQSDAGIWTVGCVPFFPGHGVPAVVALDDKGRCLVLSVYSGKWTPWTVVHDGKWLGGLAHADVDPRRDGSELYVGGQGGNLYQVTPHPQGGFDSFVIAYLPGREIHTIVAAELDATRTGLELLAFTSPGGLYLLEPVEGKEISFRCTHLQDLPGRVRDAVVLSGSDATPTRVITVSRAGDVSELTFERSSPTWRVLYRTEMGVGRIAAGTFTSPGRATLYIACDDGRIVRLQEGNDGRFTSEVIYAGAQGPRGIAVGRFDPASDGESVAVFGYSREVVLLTKGDGEWRSQVIFTDSDKGHWLAKGELDGRNSTDELILSGYSARVVVLSRPSINHIQRPTESSAASDPPGSAK